MVDDVARATRIPQRVLVIDDDAWAAPEIAAIVRQLGYECVGPCHDAPSAMAILLIQRPDAAILSLVYGGTLFVALTDALVDMNVPFGFANGVYPAPPKGQWVGRPHIGKPYTIDGVRGMIVALLP